MKEKLKINQSYKSRFCLSNVILSLSLAAIFSFYLLLYSGEGINKVAATTNFTYSMQENNITNSSNYSSCNCVIFRMDDIQDYWLNSIQNAVMDLFIEKNQTLSLGLVMNSIGNDTKIVDKVEEGFKKGLFELVLHGWDHVEYTKLSEREQQASLLKSNLKMQRVFGTNSSVFIPPLSVFNEETLRAMQDLGLNVISSDMLEEAKFDQNKSIFVANSAKNKATTVSNGYNIYHLPATIFFKDFEKGEWLRIPNEEILANSTKNIEKYGYAVVVLHPQDFALLDNSNGTKETTFINQINQTEISDLSNLVDMFLSNNMRIVGFQQVVSEYR